MDGLQCTLQGRSSVQRRDGLAATTSAYWVKFKCTGALHFHSASNQLSHRSSQLLWMFPAVSHSIHYTPMSHLPAAPGHLAQVSFHPHLPLQIPGRGFALPPWFSDGSEKRCRFSVQLFPCCKVMSEKFQAPLCLSWKVKA